MSIQAVIVMAGALALMLSTILLVRRRLLSIRYGLGWLTVSVCGVLGAPVLSIASRHVEKLGFTATGFSLGLFIAFLGLVCLQLSITLSGLHGIVQDLAEHGALLDQRIREIEEERQG